MFLTSQREGRPRNTDALSRRYHSISLGWYNKYAGRRTGKVRSPLDQQTLDLDFFLNGSLSFCMCNPFFLSALLKAVCDYKINHACNNLENKCDGCTYRTVVCEEAWESIFSCLFYLAKHENEILTADIFFPFLFQQKLNCSAKVILHLTK